MKANVTLKANVMPVDFDGTRRILIVTDLDERVVYHKGIKQGYHPLKNLEGKIIICEVD